MKPVVSSLWIHTSATAELLPEEEQVDGNSAWNL